MLTLKLQGQQYQIDEDKLPLGLLADLEDEFGFTMTELFTRLDKGSAKAMIAMVWLVKTHAGEKVTPKAVRELNLDDFDVSDADATGEATGEATGKPESQDPTTPASEPAPEPAPELPGEAAVDPSATGETTTSPSSPTFSTSVPATLTS